MDPVYRGHLSALATFCCCFLWVVAMSQTTEHRFDSCKIAYRHKLLYVVNIIMFLSKVGALQIAAKYYYI